MKAKRVLTAIVGITQGGIGITALMLTCILYLDFYYLERSLNIQTILTVSPELVPLSLLFLGVFGFFSVISGLFLLREH